MIVVNNTKELEAEYDLNNIPDNEMIMVTGGLSLKQKYDADRYYKRVTYSARDLKQIIAQMREIESEIPDGWNEWQKAKYIYETLGEAIVYNYNREEYSNQQSSNLTILLSGKGICAGYSLLFKEMMDRQSIQCDYVRGIAGNSQSGTERHAWNILTIGSQSFPVDLTWDAAGIQKGNKELRYFGDNVAFTRDHVQDEDERNYNLLCFSPSAINAIDTEIPINEIGMEEKKIILQRAIEETYKKFAARQGKISAENQIQQALKNYIKENYAGYFTRDNGARQDLQKYVSSKDVIEILAEEYVEEYTKQDEIRQSGNVLESAVQENLKKYSKEHAVVAMKNYILQGNVNGFTRQGNARGNIQEFMTQDTAIDLIIESMIERIAQDLSKSGEKQQFSVSEFAKVELPKEKAHGIINKAINWIDGKINNKGVER